MRFWDRKGIVPPDILVDPEGLGASETKLAIAYFSKRQPVGKAPAYKVYSNPAVKDAVKRLSYNKCAYCESLVLAIDDGDIEHFRPKGEITIDNKISIKPGYYWLGANWENLFLSCKHCNQARKQLTPDGHYKTLGKQNQFPLSDNKKRIKTYKRNLVEEEPYRLLINPSIENPLDHLEFDDLGMIYPVELTKNKVDPKGETSIHVFALLRNHLVEARKERALIVMSALKSYEDQVIEFNRNIDEFSEKYKREKVIKLKESIENLRIFTSKDKPYSAMSFKIIRRFLSEYGIEFNE